MRSVLNQGRNFSGFGEGEGRTGTGVVFAAKLRASMNVIHNFLNIKKRALQDYSSIPGLVNEQLLYIKYYLWQR